MKLMVLKDSSVIFSCYNTLDVAIDGGPGITGAGVTDGVGSAVVVASTGVGSAVVAVTMGGRVVIVAG